MKGEKARLRASLPVALALSFHHHCFTMFRKYRCTVRSPVNSG
jgi:hypothetical protein